MALINIPKLQILNRELEEIISIKTIVDKDFRQSLRTHPPNPLEKSSIHGIKFLTKETAGINKVE